MSHASDEISHVMPPKILLGVFAALLVLTAATVAVTTVDFGPTINLVIAMAIAAVKATLVAAFFMHLLYDNKLNLVIFLSSFAFLFLFVTFTLMDSQQNQAAIADRVQAQETEAANAD